MANFLNPPFADPFKSVPDMSFIGQAGGSIGQGIANAPAAGQRFTQGQQAIAGGQQQLELGQQQIDRNKLLDAQKKAAIEQATKEPGALAAIGETYLSQIEEQIKSSPEIQGNPELKQSLENRLLDVQSQVDRLNSMQSSGGTVSPQEAGKIFDWFVDKTRDLIQFKDISRANVAVGKTDPQTKAEVLNRMMDAFPQLGLKEAVGTTAFGVGAAREAEQAGKAKVDLQQQKLDIQKEITESKERIKVLEIEAKDKTMLLDIAKFLETSRGRDATEAAQISKLQQEYAKVLNDIEQFSAQLDSATKGETIQSKLGPRTLQAGEVAKIRGQLEGAKTQARELSATVNKLDTGRGTSGRTFLEDKGVIPTSEQPLPSRPISTFGEGGDQLERLQTETGPSGEKLSTEQITEDPNRVVNTEEYKSIQSAKPKISGAKKQIETMLSQNLNAQSKKNLQDVLEFLNALLSDNPTVAVQAVRTLSSSEDPKLNRIWKELF